MYASPTITIYSNANTGVGDVPTNGQWQVYNSNTSLYHSGTTSVASGDVRGVSLSIVMSGLFPFPNAYSAYIAQGHLTASAEL